MNPASRTYLGGPGPFGGAGSANEDVTDKDILWHHYRLERYLKLFRDTIGQNPNASTREWHRLTEETLRKEERGT